MRIIRKVSQDNVNLLKIRKEVFVIKLSSTFWLLKEMNVFRKGGIFDIF